MLSFIIVASAIFSVISANRVIHLNSDNFDAVVDGTRNVFVKFEASWCGPCKRMAPILDQVAQESFPNLDGETVLAAIDADAEKEIGDRFEIDSFPTIKLFLKGRGHDEAIDFSGDRSPKNIANFINHYVNLNKNSLPEEVKSALPAVPLTQLLETLAAKPSAQKELMNNYYNNFSSSAFDKAHIPAPVHQKNLKQKKNKSKKEKKQHNLPAVQKQDSFPLVNAQMAQQMIATAGSKPVVLIFFSPNCPHCHEFMPIARKMSEKRTDAIFIRVNGDENIQFRDSFKLRYYPSIIGYYANSNGNRYELMTNDRGEDNLNSFINKLIKH